MASRRLAISSLLCDNEQQVTNKPQSSPSTSNSSSRVRVPQSPTAYSSQTVSYTSRQLPSPAHNNVYFDEQRFGPSPEGHSMHNPTHRRNPAPPFSIMDRYHSSQTPRTTHAVTTPITPQTSPVFHRSPSSPSYRALPALLSPTRPSARRERGGDVDQAFPRLDDQEYATRQVERHSPSFQSHQSPVLVSQIHTTDDTRQRSWSSVHINTHNFSPIHQTFPPPPSSAPSSSSSIVTHSPSLLPFSTTPIISTPTSSQAFTYKPVSPERSPTLLRLPEAKMTTQREPVSPSVARGGPSGLDFLLEAVEMEKTGSDGHKELNNSLGADFTNSQDRPESLSPDMSRLDTKLQHVPPLTPPYTGGYFSSEEADIHQQNIDPNSGRATKRRRPSPDSSTISEGPQRVPNPELSPPLSGHKPRSKERQEVEVTSRENKKPRSPYASTFQVPNTSSYAIILNRELPHPSYHPSLGRDRSNSPEVMPPIPVESERNPTTIHARRSPPRSKPRPRKPGSAALAAVEKELHSVSLGDRNITGDKAKPGGSGNVPISPHKDRHPPRPKPPSSSGSKPKSTKKAEFGVGTDEDVDDFFQSTFDSPKPKNAETPKAQPTHDLKAEAVTHKNVKGNNNVEKEHPHDAHPLQEVQYYAGPIVGYSSDEMDKVFDNTSPSVILEETGKVSDGDRDKELLGELADAVGAATSEDEQTDYDDQGTDAMEVDVDNELLSLIDGPTEQASRPLRDSHSGTQKSSNGADSTPLQLSNVSEGLTKQSADTPKDTEKPKIKSKSNNVDESIESLHPKTTKPKAGGRSKAAKRDSSEKPKQGKTKKEPLASSPHSSTPASITNSVLEEPLIVTSSGRMVTKSKKSAAAAAAAAAGPSSRHSSSHSRKKAVTTGEGSNPRSRSHSVMPHASVDPETQREKSAKAEEEKIVQKEKEPEEVEPEEDDRLYCICKTTYDEDRVMIACDRCDEWYHTQCVDMPDLEVDLVDQFICPNCIQQNPSLHLHTTYKRRCFSGLQHPDPNSAEACHKPSRGLLSKYCSDECGARSMHRKIQNWAKQGGNVEGLWESVKSRERRDGLVDREPGRTLPRAILAEIQRNVTSQSPISGDKSELNATTDLKTLASNRDKTLERLQTRLQGIEQEREDLKREMELISLRERLLHLALDREKQVDDCGWDQRLVWDHDEWYTYGAEVLENYWEPHKSSGNDNNETTNMDIDQQDGEFECWCQGEKKCQRHNGWQKLRTEEIEDDKRRMEAEQRRLTLREQEIQHQIQTILHPQSHTSTSESTMALKFVNGKNFEEITKKNKRKIATTA